MIRTLLEQLERNGVELDCGQVMDALWLSRHLPVREAPAVEPSAVPPHRREGPSPAEAAGQDEPPAVRTRQAEAGVHRTGPDGGLVAGLPLRVHDPGLFGDPVSPPKRFRRLWKLHPSRTQAELDPDRIIAHLAETGRLIPFLRPRRELWLEAALVVDRAASSFLWRAAAEELRDTLMRSGSFRRVRMLDLLADGSLRQGGNAVDPRRLIDAEGRTLVLVATDAVAAIWYDGRAAALLDLWARSLPVVIIQWLPEPHWGRTAIGEGRRRAVLSSPERPEALRASPPARVRPARKSIGLVGRHAIPITTLDSDSLERWARMLAQGGIPVPGVVLPLPPGSPVPTRLEMTVEQQVRLFDSTASLEARRLLRMLVAIPLKFPIIRLVHSSLLPGTGPSVVAEVMLSGLIEQVDPGDPEQARFAFRAGVAEVLPEGASARDLYAALRTVAKHLGVQFGGKSFEAALRAPDELLPQGARVPLDELAGEFARVAAPILRILGGRYRRLAEVLEQQGTTFKLEPVTGPARGGMIHVEAASELKVSLTASASGSFAPPSTINMDRLRILILVTNLPGLVSPHADRELGPAEQEPLGYSLSSLELDREIRHIHAGTATSRHRDLVSLDARLVANPDDLIRSLDEANANILHFVGHSGPEGIVLAGERNEAILVRTDALVEILRMTGERIKLVVLNSCTSMEIAHSLAEVCGCAIGMRDKIGDPAAWTFSRAFYEAMAHGESVQRAFEQGRATLALWGMREEDLPELLCRPGVDPSKIGLAVGRVAKQVRKTAKSRPNKKRAQKVAGPPHAPTLLASTSAAPSGKITDSIGMTLVPIPAGEFQMGSPDSDPDALDNERPQHRVRITRPFYLGACPVTQAQYQAVMGENPSRFKDQPENPVETVSWYDAVRFCNRLSEREGLRPFYTIDGEHVTVPDWGGAGYRLPTEAEWEYACRAGTTTRYSCGDDPAALGDHTWYSENSAQTTHPVRQKHPNSWGLHDMHGNVWEWCWDGFSKGYYQQLSIQSPVDDPLGPLEVADRVIRGGSWIDVARFLRSAFRGGKWPEEPSRNVGFRVARGRSRLEERDTEIPAGAGMAGLEPGPGNQPAPSDSEPADRTVEFTSPETSETAPSRSVETSGSVTNSIGMTLAPIPAGEFLMGSPGSDPDADDDEKHQHRVRITRPFYLGACPVTQAEYGAVMGEDPSRFKAQPENPVERVSWYDAMRFCNRLSEREGLRPFYMIEGDRLTVPDWGGAGYRLPTEAEWEYACRAGTTTRYSFGDDPATLGDYAWYSGNSAQATHPVRQKRPNPWGLHDMYGNVWEWCWDVWDAEYYQQFTDELPVDDPRGPPDALAREARSEKRGRKSKAAAEPADLRASGRVIRGGGWIAYPRYLRSAFRFRRWPGDRYDYLGFRVARVQSSR
jgi:formylglycine-generating enzyme required for sulfatase activity